MGPFFGAIWNWVARIVGAVGSKLVGESTSKVTSALLTAIRWLILLILLGLILAGLAFSLSTPRGCLFYDKWILRSPYIGQTMTKIITARFARTLATLLHQEAGVAGDR